MTTIELYAIYSQAYADFDRGLGATTLHLAASVTPIQRAVIEFAAADAANGTPLRSRQAFARAVEAGSDALGPLGLRAA